MKDDVLEQIVDDYLQFKGFPTHNVRFRPRPDHPEWEGDQDRVPSDVDVVGLHRIAVTRLQGDGDVEQWAREWLEDPTIKANLDGCSFGFLTLEKMWGHLLAELKTTPASREIGRLAQLL